MYFCSPQLGCGLLLFLLVFLSFFLFLSCFFFSFFFLFSFFSLPLLLCVSKIISVILLCLWALDRLSVLARSFLLCIVVLLAWVQIVVLEVTCLQLAHCSNLTSRFNNQTQNFGLQVCLFFSFSFFFSFLLLSLLVFSLSLSYCF